MVEFSCGLRGMALNLEASNVGVVIFGDDRSLAASRSFSLEAKKNQVSFFLLSPRKKNSIKM